MCGFVRSRAIGPPAFAASAEGERAAAYAEFQGRVEDALEVLLDELDLVDQSEECHRPNPNPDRNPDPNP